MSPEVLHYDIWFEGHVQGVGFRAQVLVIARGYEVTGTVKNLVDGRVFVQVEGADKEVADFVAEVRRQLSAYIRKVESREFRGAPCFNSFQLSF
jgi:acylphosphatase